MFLFKNYYLLFFNTSCINILKYNYFYYLNYCHLNFKKNMIIPLSKNIMITSSCVVIYFHNDINLYKNYFYYLKFMFQSWERFVLKKIKYRYKGSWIYLKKKKIK